MFRFSLKDPPSPSLEVLDNNSDEVQQLKPLLSAAAKEAASYNKQHANCEHEDEDDDDQNVTAELFKSPPKRHKSSEEEGKAAVLNNNNVPLGFHKRYRSTFNCFQCLRAMQSREAAVRAQRRHDVVAQHRPRSALRLVASQRRPRVRFS